MVNIGVIVLVAEIFFMAAQNTLQFALFKGIQINFLGEVPGLSQSKGYLVPIPTPHVQCIIHYQ